MSSFKDSLKVGQTHIKSKAAVAWGPGEPLKMEEICLLYTSPSPRD